MLNKQDPGIKHTQHVHKNILRKKNFSVDMIVENGDKRKFLENLVKGYNDKKKNNDSRNYIHSKKTPWVPNIGPKIRIRFKKR